MKLFLIAYANAAIVAPALWIGARLWLERRPRTPAPGLVSAQIIAFPAAKRGVGPKTRARDPIGGPIGEWLTRRERRRLQKADQYIAARRRSLPRIDRPGDEQG